MKPNIHAELTSMHHYLMRHKFPYHSVSVIYRQQDLGLHVIFLESVKNLITEEIKNNMKICGFTWTFVNDEKSEEQK